MKSYAAGDTRREERSNADGPILLRVDNGKSRVKFRAGEHIKTSTSGELLVKSSFNRPWNRELLHIFVSYITDHTQCIVYRVYVYALYIN